jgi:VanZ family protein
LLNFYEPVARILAWLGIAAIVVLSVVPAEDRPVIEPGHSGHFIEHVSAFALVAAAVAVGYRLSLGRLLVSAFLFCGAIELLQVPLPTRHARASDFLINFAAACFAIGLVEAFRRAASAVAK